MAKKATGRAMTLQAGIGFGLLASLLITLVGGAVLAYLILGEQLQESSLGYGVMAIHAAASAVGALLAAQLTKRRRLLVCGICAGVYILVLLACTALLFGGQYQGFLTSVITVLIGSGAAALTGLRGKSSVRRRPQISAYR